MTPKKQNKTKQNKTSTNISKHLLQKYLLKKQKQKTKQNNNKQTKKIFIRKALLPIFPPETFYVKAKFQWMLQELQSNFIISYLYRVDSLC